MLTGLLKQSSVNRRPAKASAWGGIRYLWVEEAKRAELQGSLEKLPVQQQSLQESLSTYHQALHAITQAIHPFNLTTGDWQLWQGLSKSLLSHLEQLRSLAICYGTQKAQTAIDTFEQQIPSFAEGIHAWWRWVGQALNAKTSDIKLQKWVLESLLPWVYWHQQADKTQKSELKVGYQDAASQAYTRLKADPLTQQLDATVRQQLFNVTDGKNSPIIWS